MKKLRTIEQAQKYILLEARAVAETAKLLDESFEEVVAVVANCKGKVFITGAGTSSFIARRMAHLMAVTGTPAIFISAMDALHGSVGAVEAEDVLIAISKSGESDEVCKLVNLLSEKKVLTVGLTESANSTLASRVDITCIIRTIEDADPGNFIAMGSTLVAAVWGDALARTVMDVLGWQLDKSLDLHPAGGVGKRVAEIRKELGGAKEDVRGKTERRQKSDG
ncbi:SIS domain-containing protein [Actinobaculum suis]|uniref:SIS domain-containing protein n=1 Tax=Actinobaculum suis TaxID=1657 RepID=UPI00080A6923|nr:SIS domain-containing protein [Actinobaculum suis]OCA93578.1 hypothetical protein ACU20_08815 [Actinobaculum suis]